MNRRAAAAGVARRSRAFMTSPVGVGTALPSETGLKKQKRAWIVDLRAFLRFPGRGGCHLASARRPRGKQPRPGTSVAGTAMQDSGHDRNQCGQNSGITRRSSIYARFCVFLAPRPRCNQPRPKTSVAGKAMQDSGHGRAQRGQNTGITQNRA